MRSKISSTTPFEVSKTGHERDNNNHCNDDPRLRHSPLSKTVISIIISASTSVSCLASDIYYPSIPKIEVELQASQIGSTLALALYLLFMGIAPICLGALSDFYETRRRIMIPSFILFTGSSIGIALIQNIHGLIVLRCFQATGASISLVLGPAIITDIYPVENRGKAFGYFTLGYALGPTIAPTLGGLLGMTNISWRASFWFCAGCGVFLTIMQIIFIPETFRKHEKFDAFTTIETAERNYEQSISGIKNSKEKENEYKQQNKGGTKRTFNPIRPLSMLRYPHILMAALTGAISFGVWISIDTIIPNLFHEKYGFNTLEIGLVYLSGGISNILSSIVHGKLSDKLLLKTRSSRKDNGGRPMIEDRITLNVWPSSVCLIPLGALLFGWAVEYEMSYWICLVGYGLLSFGSAQVIAISSTYLTDSIPDEAASVAAGNTVIMMGFTTCLSLSSISIMNKIGPGYLTIIFAILGLFVTCLLILVKLYGQRLRRYFDLEQEEEK